MVALKFASSHNMVAFLDKPTESDGFKQITTAKVKTVNGEVHIQALVDKKKVIITETSVKSNLQLEDAEVFLDKQVEGMSKHKEIYVTPSHTKNVFANMKRQGKDFLSGPTEPVTGDTKNVGRKILNIDPDEDITLDSTHVDIDPDMFGVHDLHGDEVEKKYPLNTCNSHINAHKKLQADHWNEMCYQLLTHDKTAQESCNCLNASLLDADKAY
ncbi:hypothetical protein Tco_0650220 [Tanacetum coccineum]